jgi:hypothetical protein
MQLAKVGSVPETTAVEKGHSTNAFLLNIRQQPRSTLPKILLKTQAVIEGFLPL